MSSTAVLHMDSAAFILLSGKKGIMRKYIVFGLDLPEAIDAAKLDGAPDDVTRVCTATSGFHYPTEEIDSTARVLIDRDWLTRQLAPEAL